MILGKLKQFVPTMFKKSGKIGQKMTDYRGYRGDVEGISEPSDYDIESHGTRGITNLMGKVNKKAHKELHKELRRELREHFEVFDEEV